MSSSLGIISLALSTLLIFITNKVFLSKNITDEVNKRSSHTTIATRSGGIAVFVTLFIISSINYLIGNTIFDFSYLVPLSLLVAIGSYDDIFTIDFKLKLIFQIIAAKMIVDTGLLIDNFHGILGIYEINRAIAQLLTMFIVISIINAINFIDGVDGLAISIFTFFIVAFEFFSFSITPLYYFSIIILASLAPLYYFNFRKRKKVFLGDSGSHLLGGMISIYVIFILSQNYSIKPQFDIHKILFIISILSYPIIDLVRIVFIRLKNKKSPFQADKKHIHHYILGKTKNHFFTTLSILIISLFIMVTIIFLS
ncbi:MAG: undecaprenyl/decaprenyl-phosphate alpha-N-acetylglucosaminyl 1-phosphate transferase [Pelagibacteraceae bacterium]|jgi:UDP-GlcNAc:undecaprenyl-phosphate/decaprenyl-phosphate GlcNAc-1-phosphate transferase|nr:undecaprenyl/decaprenyl-phosphate alpha-N-acetylglucosaminyl 1-phosphate transferase [Pelagibacteraceae bacterium]MBT5772010.1 undecaprenyl/decaprenyl-phosphate alpha-N-acetylglucosaminyl 1-phosphate transferase [Flavobacteriaceae bacterium]MBT6353375.1 undecaprenyl/decaprenyl-phosphate alpha-N-acetylglucosaminyl 1-phosphate transferase [Pelagibacteraceae bacterium]